LVFPIFNISSYPWGEEGHKLITRKSIESLPAELKAVKDCKELIIIRSIDADKRRDFDSSENPKHYIDLDYYKEFRQGMMIKDREQIEKIYGDSTVLAIGILPWATFATFENLVTAFKRKNKELILRFISDLAHYVEDGHQPMHTLINYDGQLSGQEGIHYRYESEMVNMYLDDLADTFDSCLIRYVPNPLDFIFEYIIAANSYSDLLYSADNFAFLQSGSRENTEYFKLFWFKTKYITAVQFQAASCNLASLIYSAWLKAGKPFLKQD
jgi:hypothetical protein